MFGLVVIGFLGASLLTSPSNDERHSNMALMSLENGERTPINGINGIDIYDEAMRGDEPHTIKTSQPSAMKGRGHQRYGSRVKFTTTFELTTPQMIRDSLCWLVIATKICVGVSGFYVAATYKNFGQTAISDDHFITVVGCFGYLCSGLSRMFWGLTADRIGHFQTLELTAYLSSIVMILYTLSVKSKIAFGLCVCSLYGLWGAGNCLMPSIATFLFGEKHMGTNYGFIFLVFGLLCTFIIDAASFTGWSFSCLNYVFIVISVIGAGLCSHLRYLTSKVKDEKVLKHHRATSSVSSMM